MKTYKNIYQEIISLENLFLAYKKARKGKTKKDYVKEFERDLENNLIILHEELKNKNYTPKPLKTFILRDPKTRKISKSNFRDRVVHHALVRIIEPIFDKTFIESNCAGRKRKGTLFAINKFNLFFRKVTKNYSSKGYCFKADIKHYFQEVDHDVLLEIIKRKIKDEKVIWLINQIIKRERGEGQSITKKVGMPLGNLTSQFFANIYLNELDYFVKHKLRVKYYIRYVDDFVILHESKEQLEIWREEINSFLKEKLKLELHNQKSKIISLSNGVDFVGFRNFYHFRLLRKRNIRSIKKKVDKYKIEEISKDRILEIFQGWNAYAKWANSYKVRRKIISKIYSKEG